MMYDTLHILQNKPLSCADQLAVSPFLHPGQKASSITRQLQSQPLIFGPKWCATAKWAYLRARQRGTADFVFMQISGTVRSVVHILAWHLSMLLPS